ncbi:peptidoglycan-binding protein [Candidatus Kaiserbacteria bacterium]|nr:peptidoglycan-binding protein [Candidatus Kaiserbacteria bacterium]
MRVSNIRSLALQLLIGLSGLGLIALPTGVAFAASVSVQSISPGTSLIVGQTLTFTVVGAGIAGTPLYFVNDSTANTSVNAATINSTTGAFSWTPTVGDIGTHVITVEATDGTGPIAKQDETITVNSKYSVAIQSLSPSASPAVGSTVTFTAVPSGFSPTGYTVSDSVNNTTVTSNNISAAGVFNWTPSLSDIGTHVITVTGTDASGVTGKGSTSITVQPQAYVAPSTPVTPPVVPPAPTTVTAATGVVSVTNPQLQVIISLLQLFGVSQNVINQVSAVLLGTPIVGTSSSAAPTSSGVYVFTSLLQLGQTSTEVARLQARLAQLGYFSGTASGYFGAQTQAAVEAFQSAKGLSPVGFVGPATRAALNEQ